MKEKVLKNLQTFAKGIFVPVLILPIVGILFAFASIFTNSRVYNLIPFLNNGVFINFGKNIRAIFNTNYRNLLRNFIYSGNSYRNG